MLITDDRRACIADIGVYASVVPIIYTDRYPILSSWAYKSPEELQNGTFSFQADVYSFACTVYSVSPVIHSKSLV